MNVSGKPADVADCLIKATLLLEAARRSGRDPIDWLNMQEEFLLSSIKASEAASDAVSESAFRQAARIITEQFLLARGFGGFPADGSHSPTPGLTVTPVEPSR